MKKLQNLQESIIGLDDKPLLMNEGQEYSLGQAIANILVLTKTSYFDSFKCYELGTMFYKNKEVELQEADIESLKKIVGEDKTVTHLVKGQIIGYLNNSK